MDDEHRLGKYAFARIASTQMARRLSTISHSREVYLNSLQKMIDEMNDPHCSRYDEMNRTQKKDRLKRYLRTAEGLAEEVRITMSKAGKIGYEFNINSSAEIMKLMYDKLGLIPDNKFVTGKHTQVR